jgi:hypothetical protein
MVKEEGCSHALHRVLILSILPPCDGPVFEVRINNLKY